VSLRKTRASEEDSSFSEEKEAKRLLFFGLHDVHLPAASNQRDKRFLLLFFKKEESVLP
jgi:hypothetical protein